MRHLTKEAPFAESNAWLLDRPNYIRMWMIFHNVVMQEPGMSSRKLPEEMTITFARAGIEYFPFRDNGYFWLPDDLDYVLAANDPDFRSLRHYLECAPGADAAPRRLSRRPDRLRVLNLYLKLRYGDRFLRHLEP